MQEWPGPGTSALTPTPPTARTHLPSPLKDATLLALLAAAALLAAGAWAWARLALPRPRQARRGAAGGGGGWQQP